MNAEQVCLIPKLRDLAGKHPPRYKQTSSRHNDFRIKWDWRIPESLSEEKPFNLSLKGKGRFQEIEKPLPCVGSAGP